MLGVESSEGKINVAVYNQRDGFLKFDSAYTAHSATAKKGITLVTIENLPNGEYALAIFHDKNKNGKLDTNWLGIPKEAVGFSNATMKTFGPPSFEECTVPLKADGEIKVVIQ